MDKKTWVIAIAIVIIIVGLGVFYNFVYRDEPPVMEKNESASVVQNQPKPDVDSKVDKDSAVAKIGSYESYSPDKLARAEKGIVVLFFRASWCPTCRALDASIRSGLGTIPEGVTILDVDYDNSTALKQKYGVTYQHTLVQVNTSGGQLAKWTGSPTLSDLVSKIK
jgi:thioredoxin 1